MCRTPELSLESRRSEQITVAARPARPSTTGRTQEDRFWTILASQTVIVTDIQNEGSRVTAAGQP
jgi:hypothetical protein